MNRIICTIALSGWLAAFNFSHAQEISCDHLDHKKAVVEKIQMGGKTLLKNGYGEILQPKQVYSMSLQDRIDRGYTQQVNANDAALRSSNSGNVTFNITYLDLVNSTGKGFDDPMLGDQRMNVLNKAFAYFASVINNTGEIDIEIQESFAQNSNAPFAFSAPYYYSSKGFNDALTTAHLLNGYDPVAGYPDGYMQFNFGSSFNYNFSMSAAPAGDQFDFYTVALHEIMHVLGFSSFCAQDGSSQAPNDYVYTAFDAFLMTDNGEYFLQTNGSGANLTVTPSDPVYLTNNQMQFEAAESVNSPVYSPSNFGGSSIDHFDASRGSGNYLMHPSLSKGKRIGELNPNEAMTLQQLGYDINLGIATSMSEVDQALNVKASIYPNPAATDGGVFVNFDQDIHQEILVIVYDMMGREAYSKVLLTNGNESGPYAAIDPHNNLAPGMYIVIGSTNDELFNEKLIITDGQDASALINR